jgi:hypothetical protein
MIMIFIIIGIVQFNRSLKRDAANSVLPVYNENDVKATPGISVNIHCRLMRPRLGSYCRAYHEGRYKVPVVVVTDVDGNHSYHSAAAEDSEN